MEHRVLYEAHALRSHNVQALQSHISLTTSVLQVAALYPLAGRDTTSYGTTIIPKSHAHCETSIVLVNTCPLGDTKEQPKATQLEESVRRILLAQGLDHYNDLR